MAPLKFTPKEFISVPQRTNIVPNLAGTHALYSESIYTPSTDTTISSTYVFDLATLRSRFLSADPDIRDSRWTSIGTQISWLKPSEKLNELWLGDVEDELKSAYSAAEVPASFTLLQVYAHSEGSLGLLFHGSAKINDVDHSSVQDFSSLPVQSFARYFDKLDSTLWYARLQRSNQSGGRFSLSSNGIFDILEGTDLELQASPFVLPSGPLSCAISDLAIVYSARPCAPYKPGEYSSTLYYTTISGTAIPSAPSTTTMTSSYTGQCFFPAFSPSGNFVAFTRSESSTNPYGYKAIFILDTKSNNARQVLLDSSKESAYIEVESMRWSSDENTLLVCSTRYGRTSLVKIDVAVNLRNDEEAVPTTQRTLINDCSVSSVYELPDGRLLLSCSSLVCPSEYVIYDLTTSTKNFIDKVSLEKYGIADHQISEFRCQGVDSADVQTWALKPSSFDAGKKYPLALFMHGGPAMAWTNGWSLEWNALVLAEQGHVVVMPNFRGSAGVSSRFKQSVIGHLGDIPTHDLESCMRYVSENLSYVDVSRATALGGSFGGYLAFWIAGKPFAKRFKALVSHAGVFVAPALAGSDIPDWWRILFGGLSADPKALTRAFVQWNPAMHSHSWDTPMLISVGEKDRQVPFTHGVGAFSALQMKGVESRLLVFPDEGHTMGRIGNLLRWYEVVVDWVNKHTNVDSNKNENTVS